jgi:hypothetical protein
VKSSASSRELSNIVKDAKLLCQTGGAIALNSYCDQPQVLSLSLALNINCDQHRPLSLNETGALLLIKLVSPG